MDRYNDTVLIDLDRTRVLRASHRAIKKLTAMWGGDVTKALDAGLSGKRLEQAVQVLSEQDGLDNGDALKADQMEELLDRVPYGYVVGKVVLAFSAAMPPVDDKGDIEAPAEKNAGTETEEN